MDAFLKDNDHGERCTTWNSELNCYASEAQKIFLESSKARYGHPPPCSKTRGKAEQERRAFYDHYREQIEKLKEQHSKQEE